MIDISDSSISVSLGREAGETKNLMPATLEKLRERAGGGNSVAQAILDLGEAHRSRLDRALNMAGEDLVTLTYEDEDAVTRAIGAYRNKSADILPGDLMSIVSAI